MKATIDLPDDVFQQAQNLAIERGLDLNEFLADGLTKLIQASQPSPPTSGKRVDFPIIKAKPGASVITKEMVDFSEEQILKEEAEHHGKSHSARIDLANAGCGALDPVTRAC